MIKPFVLPQASRYKLHQFLKDNNGKHLTAAELELFVESVEAAIELFDKRIRRQNSAPAPKKRQEQLLKVLKCGKALQQALSEAIEHIRQSNIPVGGAQSSGKATGASYPNISIIAQRFPGSPSAYGDGR